MIDGRQAIVTKYLGPTNMRGSRVKATAQVGGVILEWDDDKSREDNHRAAAEVLMMRYGWHQYSKLYSGFLPDGSMVFVQVDKREGK